ncbi:MAG: FAD-dependent oxidoreductase [Acidobacteriota bacterium]|nr:FAD-dependent oxidoreductase [Acidobacteriota bacterium]
MSRIAVIGAGISGMAAAYLLSQKHEISLFEKEARLGGHTHTHNIETSRGILPIDTGFIVHNERTYPNLVRLFRKLGIERQPSDMSFGVSCRDTGFEYSTRGLGGFFGSNLLRLSQYRLFAEILRFNREARRLLQDPANESVKLGNYIRAHDFEGDFARYYLNPMSASVWSTSLEEIEEFPAFTLFRFLDNHGLLGITTQAQWQTLKGGSSVYIAPLTAPYRQRIRLGAKIKSVIRTSSGIQIVFEDIPPEQFDEVVFASHAPQAMGLLKDASPLERRILENFNTRRNQTVLHTDSHLLPRRPSARASWNYHLGASRKAPTLTYHMNRLQGLATREDYCVTLNDADSVRDLKILHVMDYFHPLYTIDAVRAQSRWSEISGHNHTHFCGAYWFYGFHEDGLNSAIRVAAKLGVAWDTAI